MELPKDQAVLIEPYDTVTVQGFYRSQPEVNDAITKAAREKGAYSFYIVRQVDANQAATSVLPHSSTKLMRKNALCKALMQSQQILMPDAPH